MLSIPHRAQDDKFTSSIEGYRGSIHKLGRLLAHDRFSVTFGDITKERYLFLFKARVLISKVRRISDDRSIFQLKDIIRLPQVEVKDHPDDDKVFELVDRTTSQCLILKAHRDNIKKFWLREIREYSKNFGESEETTTSDEFQIASPPSEPSQSSSESVRAKKPSKLPVRKESPPKREQEKENRPPIKEEPKKPKTEVKKLVGVSKTVQQDQLVSELKQSIATKSSVVTLKASKQSESNSETLKTKREEASAKVTELSSKRSLEATKTSKSEETTLTQHLEEIKAVEPVHPVKKQRTTSAASSEDDHTLIAQIEGAVSEADTQVESADSDFEEDDTAHHLKKISALEPLIQINKPRVLEEKLEYIIKPPPELVPGSALNKVLSIEKSGQSDTKLTDIKVGVEFNVEVGDNGNEMSRRYTSTSSKEGGYDSTSSSFSRRSVKSSSASAYGTGDPLTRYGGGVDLDSTSKYSSRKSYSIEPEESYTSRTSKYESPELTTSKYSSSRSAIGGNDESYYSKRSLRGSIEVSGTGDSYTMKKSLTTEDPSDSYSYKRSLGSEIGSKYTRRSMSSTSTGTQEELLGVRRHTTARAIKEDSDDEELMQKYSPKYVRSDSASKRTAIEDEDEDIYAKYKRKYSSSDRKLSTEEDAMKYSRRISRTDSVEKKNNSGSKKAEEEEDAYEKYARKYLRKDENNGKAAEIEERLETSTTQKIEATSFTKTEFKQEATAEIAVAESSSQGRERSAEEKLEEIDDGKLKFIKTIRGTTIELSTEERADRSKTDKPEFLVCMKDAELLQDTYLRFMVKVVGEPNPEISFFKDGKKITETQERMQVIRDHSDKGFYELVIPEVKKQDAGIYKCVATNKFGEASSEATVTVTDNREIFKEMPEGELLPQGEKPSFLWKKDGTNFDPDERFKVLMGDDEDSLALVFQHVKPDDVGLYTCVAQTSRGHISCSAELTVHGTVNQLFREPEKPRLIIEKKEPIVTAGNQAMLELQVKGYPKPQVRWTHEGKPIEPSGKYKFLYEDEECISLIIKDVRSEDAGKYMITAENELGSDSAEMKLTVTAPPKIKNKMEDISIHTDQLLKMSVDIEGIPKPKVQFYKDGKEIKQNEHMKIVEENEKYSLVIEKTSLTDTGSYSVVATNELAQVSQFWKLEVYSKPKILQKLGASKEVSQGETVEMKVKIEAEPKAEVKWYKDEEEIKSSEHFVIKEDGDTYLLRITGAVTTDSAKYKFKAMNIHGTGEDEVRMDVKKAPKIIQGLENRTVTEHDKNVTFDVRLEAFPKPTVKWYLDEIEIQETRTEFTRMESDNGVKLVIKEVTSELSGQYTCKLSNEVGVAETSAKLTVNCAPRILKQLKDTTVEEGASLHLEVEVGGCPPPTVKWLRNGREVSADARIKISRDTKREETYNLDVSLIKYEEQGEYEVIVTNALGTVSSKSYVTVHKVTHTDAIEEFEDEAANINVDVVEERQSEDVEETEPKQPEGPQQIKHKKQPTAEPIVEEPASPSGIKVWRGISATIEEIEEIDEDPSYPSHMSTEYDVTQSKSHKNAKLLDIEEIEEVQHTHKVSVEEEIVTKRSNKAQLATKQSITFEENDEAIPKSPEPASVDVKLKKAVAKPEDTDFEQHVSSVQAEDVDAKIKIKKPTEVKESLDSEDVEATVTKYELQNTEDYNEDITTDDERLNRTEEEVVDTKTKAEPMILDTNMKDGSRPESLDITYIVHGFANPPPTATWTLDGKVIKPDGHLRMTTSQKGDEFRLEIKKLEMRDAGVYEVTLSNVVGAVKQKAILEVTPERDLRRPKVKHGLKDQTIVKKNSVTYKAVIIGDPMPDISWCKDGKPITNDEFEKNKIILESEDHAVDDGLTECTFSLTIPRCERSNAGKYSIKAANKWGEAESSAQLTIVLRPEIEGPEDVKVVPGEATEFTVVVQANPEPQVLWMKDDKVIKANDLITIVEDRATETYKLVFHKVLLADEGYYKVIAKNDLGETCVEARLKTIKETEPTTERPKFITGLTEDQVVDQGEIILMVRADGLPKPSISWYLNGKQITDDGQHTITTQTETQVTSTLTVQQFGEENVGMYKATALNVVGEALTAARISMVQTAPSFGKKLDRNEDVNEGEPLELKAKVNGSPKPTVVWYKDGEPISPNDKNIRTTVLPDGTVKLNIDKCQPSDSGAYKLVLKNPNGETACLCAVAVAPKQRRPQFLKCFKDVKLPLGQELRLEAKVEAYPPPEVKWLKDGVPLRANSNLHFEKYPDGRVALVVDCMRPENAGKYELVVKNKHGEATAEALVTTEKKPIKPEFVKTLMPQTVVEGFPAKFAVKAEGYPAPKISWLRNGAEIISDNKHVKIVDQPDGTSSLVIDACDEFRDALNYRAVARNEAGEAETSASLTVQSSKKEDEPEERPVLIHGLKDATTDEGQPLVLEAPFTGNPIPTVQWTKDGEPIQASDRILMTCDGRRVGLRIDKALPSDAGVYGVTVENPFGRDTSQAKATVHKVFMPPKFTQKFTDLQQLPGNNAKFPCRVIGVPQPEITWSKDGNPIRESDKYHIKRDGDVCCLYVNECESNDAGVYRATATNKEGQDVCTASLEVVKQIKSPQKIEPPTFLKRIGDTELFKGMTAKFTACATGIPEPTIEWYHNDKKIYPSKRIRMDKDTAGLLRLSILGVDQDDIGKYSCKIYNEHGSDICHANLKFDEGLEAKPKRPVTDQYTEYDTYKRSGAPVPISDPPIISQMTDRHCTLSWKPSIPSGPREPVTYQLEMCELPNGDWFTVRTGIRSCICGVRNLEPFRDYRFRVRVENKYGLSDPSPYAVTHRQKLEPDLPKFRPYLPPEVDFRPDISPYFPKDFDIERPPHDGMSQAPMFLRQEHDTQYGVKDQNTSLFWFVYGYPKPKITYYFNDELIESGGRFDMSYTRNGQATLFINKMLDRDVGWYEAVARNEHGEARQRVRLEIAEAPYFIRRPDVEYVMVRGRAKFDARVIGVPYPEIKWYRDWKPLAASSRIKILFTPPDTTTLIINDVIYKDEGLYSCAARNVAGTASSSAMMHVEDNDFEYNMRTYSNLSPCKPHKRLYTDFYDIGDELGRGTQGVTYHAVERLNGRNYAAKVMHGSGELRPFMYNELDALNQLRHKKLISLRDAYETEDSLALILELGGGGELVSDYLLKTEYYTESDIAGFIRQLMQGLDYMHERGFGHLGLNLGDLLIAHPGGDDLKITDFSLSRRVSLARLYPLLYGMPEYVSPECTNNDGVGLGHDMWSVGIITYILLSGRSPFRGANDRETLTNIRSGKWVFDEDRWSRISVEAKDFITNLLVYQPEGRMDVHAGLRHPWLEKADKRYLDEYQISSKYLSEYWKLYREWMDNASCRNWFRRRPLEGAFTHPSKMVYPPGERYTPRSTPAPLDKTPRTRGTWEDQLPNRSPLNYEIGIIKSESHYQNGPDTYLLQLRDVDFPCRLREYMKVAVNRGPGSGYILSDDSGYDWSMPIIRERRRFTDIMDEEIDDERKARINRYGTDDTPYIRRLKHELGSRLDTYVEAEAFLESKHDGRLPFFREKPGMTAMIEGKDLELTCLAVGEPTPIVQWFKNDSIVAESHRIKIFTDAEGRSHYRLTPALAFDQGLYKIVARNKIGQTIARTRIVLGLVPDEPDSPEATKISDSEILLTWKQPKHDGNSPVVCYKLEYKLADDTEWIKKADNIDHEFYLIRGLEPHHNYIFRLAARNAIGWSDPGVPTAPIQTKTEGTSKIHLTKAMAHIQEITDSGKEVEPEKPFKNNYKLELEPVTWEHASIQEHYNFISEIYRGKFSTVLKAVDKRTDDVVITKVIDISDQKKKDEAEGEFAALRSLRHERIASLIAAYHSQDKAVFVLEKLQGADVLTYLASRHDYNEQMVATIVTQVLDGLQYLHWRGLCHLDLQPDNVVMTGVRSVQVKLVDLGSAHRVTKLGTKVPVVGHQDYMAPEVMAEEPAVPQTDIWSVGVLTYVMLSGTVPFRGQDEHESRQNTLFVRYRFENLYQEVSQEATRFLMLLFKRQPNKRPTPEECHENRWLLPTDYMIKKRERAIFLGHRIKEYSEEYHNEKEQVAQQSNTQLGDHKYLRSYSIQEELLTAP